MMFRDYYRCSSPGCPAKRQVVFDARDGKAILRKLRRSPTVNSWSLQVASQNVEVIAKWDGGLSEQASGYIVNIL